MANLTCVGSLHPSWKGGKTITSHGYVRIRLPRGHHLRGKSGSGYEHRVLAEKKYGRRLLPGEKVHHLDGNRQNNSPENLIICQSNKHHLWLHRKANSRLRAPDEPNPIIECACGCRTKFKKYDNGDRPRKYCSGCNSKGDTNPSAKITSELAMKIKHSKGTSREVANKYGVSIYIVKNMRRGKTWRNV